MQQRRELDQVYTNRKLLNGQLDTPKWWLPTVSILGVVVLIGVVVIAVKKTKKRGKKKKKRQKENKRINI